MSLRPPQPSVAVWSVPIAGLHRRWRCARAVLLVIAAGAIGAMPGPGQAAHFQPLAAPPGTSAPLPLRVNAAGDRVVGSVDPPPSIAVAWDERSHAVDVITIPLGGAVAAGSVAAGQQTSQDGLVRWTIGTAFRAAPSPDEIWLRVEDALNATDVVTLQPAHPSASARNLAIDVARDGDYIGSYVDSGSAGSFYYDAGQASFVELGSDAVPTDMDAAGEHVVGESLETSSAWLWTAATQTMQPIGPLAGGSEARARGISASGRIVVGESESAALAAPLREAFRWHRDFGIQPLEPIPPGESRESAAYATSDANVVVGRYYDGTADDFRAFIWTPDYGRRDLKAVLESTYGLIGPLFGWTLDVATSISADGLVIAGEGTDPQGNPAGWVVDLSDDEVAEIEVRPLLPPNSWEFHLRCGDVAVGRAEFGIVPPAVFPVGGGFDFAGCTSQTTVGGLPAVSCDGAGGLGPTVSQSSTVRLPLEDSGASGLENDRANTLYFTLQGQGGVSGTTLCEPGDPPLFLGQFDIDVPQDAPAIEPIPSGIAFSIGAEASGDNLPDDLFRLRRSPGPGGFEVSVRPGLDDPTHAIFTTALSANVSLSKFSFALVVPPGQDDAGAVSFGGCNEFLGGPYDMRGCADGSGLGPWIDFTTVRTWGPHPDLVSEGLRGDTLYVYLEGARPNPAGGPQMNLPDQLVELGDFRFEGPISTDPAFVPIVAFDGIELLDGIFPEASPWEDVSGGDQSPVILFASGWIEGGDGTDWDGDTYENGWDMCPYVPSTQTDGGTLEQLGAGGTVVLPFSAADGVGDECQCGDVENNDSVVVLDIGLLRDAFADRGVADGLFSTGPDAAEARLKCNSYGPVWSDLDPATGRPQDCQLNDLFVLLKARLGEEPLIPDLDPMVTELPQCPDVTTP